MSEPIQSFSNLSKLNQTCTKWSKFVKTFFRLFQTLLKVSKLAQTCSNFSKNIRNCSNFSNFYLFLGPIMTCVFKSFQIDPVLFSTFWPAKFFETEFSILFYTDFRKACKGVLLGSLKINLKWFPTWGDFWVLSWL